MIQSYSPNTIRVGPPTLAHAASRGRLHSDIQLPGISTVHAVLFLQLDVVLMFRLVVPERLPRRMSANRLGGCFPSNQVLGIKIRKTPHRIIDFGGSLSGERPCARPPAPPPQRSCLIRVALDTGILGLLP